MLTQPHFLKWLLENDIPFQGYIASFLCGKKIAVSVGIFFCLKFHQKNLSASKPLHPMFLHPTESTLDSPHDFR